MLSFLEGRIIEANSDGQVTVNAGYFGLTIEMTRAQASSLEIGEEIKLFTFLHISPQEFKLTLYGFLQAEDREIFSTLLKCPGVGPKVALSLLEMGSSRLVNAIENEELSALTGVPGIGAKTAQRIVLELKGKFLKLKDRLPTEALEPASRTEVMIALKNLGFRESEINSALASLKELGTSTEKMDVGELLRLTLEQLRK